MERTAHMLLEVVILAVLLSVALTYLRAIVLKDFYIVEGETAESALSEE